MAIADFIHSVTLDNVRAFNLNAGVVEAFEDTIQRTTEPVRAAVASAALDAAKVDGLGSFALAPALAAARPTLLDVQRAVGAQNWLRLGESVNQLARVQRFSRGPTDSAIRGIAASVIDTRSQSLGFDLPTDRINAALAAARPQTQALHKLIREPMGPDLSSLLRKDLVPSLDVPAGVTIGPRSTLASVFPDVDFDAVVDSAREVVTEPADAVEKEALRVARRNLLWTKINAISSIFGSATATLTLLLLLSGDERVQRLAQQIVDHLYELSRSLSS